jgi:parallel beta-helix repeat protein
MRLTGVVLALSACGRLGFDSGVGPDASGLVVTTTADRLAGGASIATIDDLPAGTVGLSLREAVTIAGNHPGPDRVAFDPATFPSTTPVTIALASQLVVAGDDTTVDALATGVRIAPASGFTDTLLAVTGARATLRGLHFEGGGTDAITATGVTGLVIDTATIVTPANYGIGLTDVSDATITKCVIDRSGSTPIEISTSTSSTISSSTIKLAGKTGIVFGIEITGSTNMHVLDNIIDPGDAWMIHLDGTSSSEIAGNIIDGGDTGIVLTGSSMNDLVFRNVITQPSQDSVYIDTPVTNTIVVNNTFYMCSDITDVGQGTMNLNNLSSYDPAEFVAPATYDFHLVPGSGAIDAATDYGYDMLPDSPLRYLGAGPDLGGVESH